MSAKPPGHVPPVLHAEVLRIRARLLQARGEDAAAAFDAATKAFRQLGSPYHLAVGLLDQATHLAATGERGAATHLSAEAGELASALGATSLTARAAALTGSGAPAATATTR